MKKKVLFIDRDGTLVIEPPVDYQLDAFEKLEFYPKVFRNLYFIRQKLDFELVMVTNQDGLGTPSFPEETFWPVHNLMLQSFKNEGIEFDNILIDRSFPEDNAPTRKPRTGMLTAYLQNPDYDLPGSFVIGDRATDVQLAQNLGCKAILLQPDKSTLAGSGLEDTCVLATTDWDRVAEFLFAGERTAEVCRKTKETDIRIRLNLDGNGTCHIDTGLGFFDHMLEQIGKHGGIDLDIHVDGDLHQAGHRTLRLLPAHGRLSVHGGTRLRRTPLAGVGCDLHPRKDWRHAHRDVPPFLQVAERLGPHEPAHQGRRYQRAPQD